MRFTPHLLAAAALALLSGCSTLSSLNPFSSAPKGPQPAALVEIKPSLSVRTAWTYAIGKSELYDFTPTVYNGSVLVGAADGALARLNLADGKPLWKTRIEGGLSSAAATDGSVIAVGLPKGQLQVLDMEGKPLWKAQLSSEVLSAPVVEQGMVIVRSLDNRIAGFDVKTGERKWLVQRPIPPLTLRNAPGMVVNGKEVIVAQPGGKMSALLIATGGPRWEANVGEAKGATELDRVTDVGGRPVVVERDVCAATYQGRVACFDTGTGVSRWSKELSSEVGVAADQRFVFAADDKGAVVAYFRDSGASAWKTDKLAYRRLSAPASIGRAVAVGDYQGYVHFLAREEGNLLAREKTDGSPVVGTPVVAGSTLIVQTQNGTVSAITVE
ncbi:outer membrane protein assembly factor BamB [Massilia sp. TS11]|uniref:outer membrane protein assembly factor BamB n=1 Tax=Massilia sp. TS11 TaxID=2908003 RepID=UPI001EDC60B2|nr:outer membrane protein assembly factor BamB [Massilia sp. TS11]MCG2583140.1 outer membrane protein assembly factor BamB [Massilia sp. TS11]